MERLRSLKVIGNVTIQQSIYDFLFTFYRHYSSILYRFRLLDCWLGGRKGIQPVKNGGWYRWALVSLDGVAPSWMVSVSASVNLPLHHKVQRFSSGTGSPGWSRKRAIKRLWWFRDKTSCLYDFFYLARIWCPPLDEPTSRSLASEN